MSLVTMGSFLVTLDNPSYTATADMGAWGIGGESISAYSPLPADLSVPTLKHT